MSCHTSNPKLLNTLTFPLVLVPSETHATTLNLFLKFLAQEKFSNHDFFSFSLLDQVCHNPILAKCEDETHIPKVEDLESSGTSECLEFDSKGQNTSHWGVLGVIGKVLKFRCPKWLRIGHLDICSPSYGQKKGRESTRSRRALGECDTALESSRRGLQVWFRPRPDRRSKREAMMSQSLGSLKPG
jgi:hypothetical protein